MYIFSIIAYSNKWSGIPILQKENSFKSQIKNYTTIALVKLQKQSITKTAKKSLSQKPEARYSSVAYHSGWKSRKISHFNFLWQIKWQCTVGKNGHSNVLKRLLLTGFEPETYSTNVDLGNLLKGSGFDPLMSQSIWSFCTNLSILHNVLLDFYPMCN